MRLSRLFLTCCLILQLLTACAARQNAPEDWTSFQGGISHQGQRNVPTIKQPRVRWKQRIGIQSWLNNPLIIGDRVYISSSGRDINDENDPEAGVYALDLKTGKLLWHWQSGIDTNGISYAEGLIFASLEDGSLIALTAETGKPRWRTALTHRLDEFTEPNSLFAAPLILNQTVYCGSRSGSLSALDLNSGRLLWRQNLSGPIRNGLSSDGRRIFVASQSGEIMALRPNGQILWKRTLSTPYPAWSDRTDTYPVEIFSAPLVDGPRLIVSHVRRHRFEHPALLALDPNSGNTLWQASDPRALKAEYGNLRGTPAISGPYLVFAEPLSREIVAIERQTGQVAWVSQVENHVLQHWSSAASTSESIYLTRPEGGLYAFENLSGKLLWQLYLGHPGLLGPDLPKDLAMTSYGRPTIGDGIYASPALAPDGTLIVSGGDGWLYALEESP